MKKAPKAVRWKKIVVLAGIAYQRLLNRLDPKEPPALGDKLPSSWPQPFDTWPMPKRYDGERKL